MKTLVIIHHIVCVLAVITVVYGLDAARLQMFTDNMAKCSGELGGAAKIILTSLLLIEEAMLLWPIDSSAPTAEALVCALEKDGKIFNANGEYMKDASIQGLGDVISDADTLEKARGMYIQCHDDAVQSGSTGREQTMKIATCSLPILSLLDKP